MVWVMAVTAINETDGSNMPQIGQGYDFRFGPENFQLGLLSVELNIAQFWDFHTWFNQLTTS